MRTRKKISRGVSDNNPSNAAGATGNASETANPDVRYANDLATSQQSRKRQFVCKEQLQLNVSVKKQLEDAMKNPKEHGDERLVEILKLHAEVFPKYQNFSMNQSDFSVDNLCELRSRVAKFDGHGLEKSLCDRYQIYFLGKALNVLKEELRKSNALSNLPNASGATDGASKKEVPDMCSANDLATFPQLHSNSPADYQAPLSPSFFLIGLEDNVGSRTPVVETFSERITAQQTQTNSANSPRLYRPASNQAGRQVDR